MRGSPRCKCGTSRRSRAKVTQFDLVRRRCPAGHLTQAQPPAGVAGPVCYGPNIRAAGTQIAYLGHVSMERTATLLADLLGCPVSTASGGRPERRQAGQRAGVAAAAPLHDLRGVQTVAAHRRALLPVRSGVVLGQQRIGLVGHCFRMHGARQRS